MNGICSKGKSGSSAGLTFGIWGCHPWILFGFEIHLSVTLILNTVMEAFELFMYVFSGKINEMKQIKERILFNFLCLSFSKSNAQRYSHL